MQRHAVSGLALSLLEDGKLFTLDSTKKGKQVAKHYFPVRIIDAIGPDFLVGSLDDQDLEPQIFH